MTKAKTKTDAERIAALEAHVQTLMRAVAVLSGVKPTAPEPEKGA